MVSTAKKKRGPDKREVQSEHCCKQTDRMEEERDKISRLQRGAANDVIIQNYDYIVGCVNALLIFPYLVSSRVVQQEFRQYLDGERTDKGKMMALLLELTRSPDETWFKEFVGALSKITQYKPVVGHLLKDFTELMEERQAHPPLEGSTESRLAQVNSAASKPQSPQLVINVASRCTGVDEVMKSALADANTGHKAALLEWTKASALVLEAEKGRLCAEADKLVLEERLQETSKNLSMTDDRLRVTEMHKRLLEKEVQSYKEELKENMQRAKLEKMQLTESIAEVRLQESTARERVLELEGERATLEKQVVGLQADVVRENREREEQVTTLEQQLSDANGQQQTLKEELRALWREDRMDMAREEVSEMQSSRGESSSLRRQLERSVSGARALQVELDEVKCANEKLEEEVRGLRKELTKKKQEGRGSKTELKKKKKEGKGKGLKVDPKEKVPEEAAVKERLVLQQEMGLGEELDTL